MFESFKNLIDKLGEDQKRAEENLTHQTFEVDRFSVEAINRILLIDSDLKRITAGLGVDDALSVVQGYLNSFSWKARFRTGEPGKPEPDKDSIYYVTPENISLRLKLSNRSTGVILKVIQPFMERIVFEDDIGTILSEPALGLTPQEYSSPEFISLQNKRNVDKEFISKIRQYRDENGRVVLIKNAPGGYVHTGSKINHIF